MVIFVLIKQNKSRSNKRGGLAICEEGVAQSVRENDCNMFVPILRKLIEAILLTFNRKFRNKFNWKTIKVVLETICELPQSYSHK
jgi:hypothetical protein